MTQDPSAPNGANGNPLPVDPSMVFAMAQVVTGVILAVTAFTNPTFGQLESIYKQKGLL